MGETDKQLSFLQKIVLIIAILSAAVGVASWYWSRWQREREIGRLLGLAEIYQRNDDFDEAIDQVKKAINIDPKNHEAKVRLTELKTFKVATGYDQVKVIRGKAELTELDRDCAELSAEFSAEARIIALCGGIVEELHDRPKKAIEGYDRAARQDQRYPNVHNYWAYTIFKWEFGGQTWSEDAFSHLSKAIDLDTSKTYAVPYINRAAVYGRLSNPERVKEALDGAVRIQGESLRSHKLRGIADAMVGKRLEDRHLPESRDAFSDAVREFQEAKRLAPTDASVHLFLGRVLQEMGGRDEDALAEYEDATRLDDLNVEACSLHLRLVSRLRPHAHVDQEVQKCAGMITTILNDFRERMRNTDDTAAKEWLSARVEGYEAQQQTLH